MRKTIVFLVFAICLTAQADRRLDNLYSSSVLYHYRCDDNAATQTVEDSGIWNNDGWMFYVATEAGTTGLAGTSDMVNSTGKIDGGFLFTGKEWIMANVFKNYIVNSPLEDNALFTKSGSNPLITGEQFPSLWYDGVSKYYMFICNSTSKDVWFADSNDGTDWDTRVKILDDGAVGEFDDVIDFAYVWYDATTTHPWNMLYRGNKAGVLTVGVAYSDEAVPSSGWTKNGQANLGGNYDPTWILKDGTTYYLYANGYQGHGTQCVLTSTTGEPNSWTLSTTINPVFSGDQFCPSVYKYNGYYYMLLSIDLDQTGSDPNDHAVQIFRSPSPLFEPQYREYLGWAVTNSSVYDVRYVDYLALPHDSLTYDLTGETSVWGIYTGSNAASSYGINMVTFNPATVAALKPLPQEVDTRNTARSWFAWINMSSAGSANHVNGLQSFGMDGAYYDSSPGFLFSIKNVSGELKYSVYTLSGFTTGTNVFSTDTWYHVGYTFDGVGTFTLYIDGDDVTTISSTDHHKEMQEYIGSSYPGFTSPYGRFYGTMDEIIQFSRCLTETEVEAVMADTGTGIDYPTAANVLSSDTVNGSSGTLTLPANGNTILEGTDFGVGGTSVTGNYHAPDANEVWHTATFGSNIGTAGTKVGSDISNLSAENIRSGITIDDVTGTLSAGGYRSRY